jgi:tRNA-Thr(GGU) m(6)t(6)A37 methyltransferase TsaA
MSILFEPIGNILTPFESQGKMPRQPRFAKGILGRIIVNEAFQEGLKDLEGFSHIVVLFHLDRSKPYRLSVIPRKETTHRGLFATRSPNRPNAIGLSVVKLISIEKNSLTVEGVDMLNNTPLLDIKPYIPDISEGEEIRLGWLQSRF